MGRDRWNGPQTYDPTPEEIAAECERIREGWSAKETRKRSAWADAEPWAPPETGVDEASPKE